MTMMKEFAGLFVDIQQIHVSPLSRHQSITARCQYLLYYIRWSHIRAIRTTSFAGMESFQPVARGAMLQSSFRGFGRFGGCSVVSSPSSDYRYVCTYKQYNTLSSRAPFPRHYGSMPNKVKLGGRKMVSEPRHFECRPSAKRTPWPPATLAALENGHIKTLPAWLECSRGTSTERHMRAGCHVGFFCLGPCAQSIKSDMCEAI